MRCEVAIREALINNTIDLIAQGGFEMATTAAITRKAPPSAEVKMNEVYIYRLYGGKEQLYEAAFLTLESELYHALQACVTEELAKSRDTVDAWYRIFERAWGFLLRNEEHCRCYVRYYYSVYFKGNSLATHNKHFEHIVSCFAPLFQEDANLSAIMHSVFTALLDFSIRVYNGDLENNEDNRPHIFNMLYSMLKIYLKDEAARTASIIKNETSMKGSPSV